MSLGEPRLGRQFSRPEADAMKIRSFHDQVLPRALAAAGLLSALLLAPIAHATPEKAASFYEDGLARFERNDLPGAIIQLKNAVQQDNRMVAAHLLLGKALLRNGEVPAAEAAFERALKLGVNRSEVALPLGQIYMTLGKPELVIDRILPEGLPPALRVEVLSMRGTAYAQLGKNRLAAESFAEARTIDPKSAIPLIAEVPVLLAAGDRERARSAAAKAVELAPNNAAAWNARASVQHATFDVAGALSGYERALSLEPNYVDVRVARAALLIDLKRAADAEKDLEILRKTAPGEPRAAYLRALLAGRRGDAITATAELNETVKLVDALPRNWIAGREQLLMLGALSHFSLRNWEKARDFIDLLLKRDPRHVGARKLLAALYLETGQYSNAVPLLRSLQKDAPNDPQVLYQLGLAHLGQRRYAAATEALEQAASKLNSPEARYALGMSQLGLGQDTLGVGSLEKAFAADPGRSNVGTALATLYAQRGERQKAIQVAEAMLKRDPGNLTALNFLGAVKGAAGDRAGARAAYQQALAKDPEFRPAALNLARLDISEGRIDEARRRLEAMLAKSPKDSSVLFELGLLEQRSGRTTEAIKLLQRANDIQRSDPRAGLALIDLLLAGRQPAKAVEVAKELSTRYRTNIEVQLAAGRAYAANGDLPQARLTYQEATRFAGFDPVLQVRIGRLQLAAASPDGALYSAEKALQGRPDDPEALLLIVEAEASRGSLAKAEAAAKALAAKHPDGSQAPLAAASLAMARGQHAAAAAAYRVALGRAETTGIAISLAQAQLAAGEGGKAAAFLGDWLKKRPNDLAALKALAEVQYRSGLLPAARETYAKAAAADPGDADVLNNYANLLLALKDPGAQAQAERAVQLNPGNAYDAGTLGWILVQQGQVAPGLRYLREARLRRPESGEIRYRLAYALSKSGRQAEAREELSAALSAPEPALNPTEVAALGKELGL